MYVYYQDVAEPVKKKAKIEDFFNGGKKKSADEAKKATDEATTSAVAEAAVSPNKGNQCSEHEAI